MTFAILAADPARGLHGLAQATAPMAVGSRCPRLRSGVGVACAQGNTDPKLAIALIDLLSAGAGAVQALAAVLAADPFAPMRQLAAIDAAGQGAAHTGDALNATAMHHVGDGHVVIGNGLADAGVVPAVSATWVAGAGLDFEERLARALAAGRDAGGDRNGHRSAVLIAHEAGLPFARTDLRVDWREKETAGDDAVDELLRLTLRYLPMIPYYAARAADPRTPDFDAWSRAAMTQPGQDDR